MWIFVRRSVKFTSSPWNYLSIVPYGISSILALCSQIFEYLRETFYRHALEYLQSAPSDQKQCKKNVFLRKRLTIIDLFEGLWSVATRFRC